MYLTTSLYNPLIVHLKSFDSMEYLRTIKSLQTEDDYQRVYSILQAGEQNNDSLKRASGPICKVLVKDMQQEQTTNLRLLNGCCLVHLFRIFAPNCPFDDHELRAVFDRVILVLGENTEMSMDALKQAVNVKFMVMLWDLDNSSDLFVQLVNTIFKINRMEDQVDGRQALSLQLLTQIFDEADLKQVPSKTLVDILLSRLVEQNSPTTQRLAVELLSAWQESLSFEIEAVLRRQVDQQQLSTLLKDNNRVQSFVHLVEQLNKRAPVLIARFFTSLADDVDEDEETRCQLCVLMLQLTAVRDLCNSKLMGGVLRKFRDKSAVVRKAAIAAVAQLEHTFQIDTVVQEVEGRVLDLDERVRLESIKCLHHMVHKGIFDDHKLSGVTKELHQRTRDKKISVRKQAVAALATIYKVYTQGGKTEQAFQIIRQFLLLSLTDKDLRHDIIQQCCEVEGIISGSGQEVVQILHMFQQKDWQCLCEILRQSSKTYNLVRHWLKQITKYNNNQIKPLIIHTLSAQISSMLVGNDKLGSLFERIAEEETAPTQIASLLTCKSCHQAFTILNTLKSQVSSKLGKKCGLVVKQLGLCVCPYIITPETVSKMCLHDDEVVVKMLDVITSQHPKLLQPVCYEVFQLTQVPSMLRVSLKLLCKMGLEKMKIEFAEELQTSMEEVCRSNDVVQVKYGVRILRQVTDSCGLEELQKWLEDAAADKKTVCSALVGLCILAADSPEKWQNEHEEMVAQFILQGLQDGFDDCTEFCNVIKAYGLGCRGAAAAGTGGMRDSIIEAFVGVMEGTGEDCTSAQVRLTVACCLLKSGCSSTDITYYVDLALVMQDPVMDVRQRFAQKVGAYCIKQLHTSNGVKYAAFLCLAAVDPNPYNRQISIYFLKQIVMKTTESSHSNQDLHHRPEMILPYLIFLLAQHPDCSFEGSALNSFRKMLTYGLYPLLTTPQLGSNFPMVLKILRYIKHTSCVDNENITNNAHVLCDMGIKAATGILEEHCCDIKALLENPLLGSVFLPKKIYGPLKFENQQNKRKKDGSDLPLDYFNAPLSPTLVKQVNECFVDSKTSETTTCSGKRRRSSEIH